MFAISLSKQIMDRQKLSCSMEVCGVKQRVWPPLAAMTSSHLRRIEPINRWIKACGILFHSCTSSSRSSCSVSGGFDGGTRLPSSSHKCSIGDRFGANAGQWRTRMWFWFRKSWQTRPTWHLTMSCWKMLSKFRCCRKGKTVGSRITSLYFTAFNFPWTIFGWVRPSWQIPAQTITLPPPKRSDSYTHWSVKRSPLLRYTR